MSTTAQRGARGALDAARPAIARLDRSRGSEDLAADLIELWSAVEAALRTLVGSSTLTGQPLIREARQRQTIDFDLANSLAEFQAVHDRLQNTSYHATQGDMDAARTAFLKLDSALMGDTGIEPPRAAPRVTVASTPAASAASDGVATAVTPATAPPARRPIPRWALATIGAILVVALIIGGFFAFHHPTSALEQGVDAYRRGDREVAMSAFTRAAREDTHDPVPHVYMARMAREVGNFSLASQELQQALEADPNSAIALREMGANLLAQGNYELARRFYVRAVQADPTDKTSIGYLGCTLMRLNRPSDAAPFLTRAGPGPWTSCTPAPPTSPAPLTK